MFAVRPLKRNRSECLASNGIALSPMGEMVTMMVAKTLLK